MQPPTPQKDVLETYVFPPETMDPYGEAEGKRKAMVNMWANIYTKFERYYPGSIMPQKYQSIKAAIEHKKFKPPKSLLKAVTINFGNFQLEEIKDFQTFMYVFRDKFKYSWVVDYKFIVELSPKGRLHLHGYLKIQDTKSNLRLPNANIKQRIYNCFSSVIKRIKQTRPILYDQYKLSLENFLPDHIYIIDVFDQEGWKTYMMKQTLEKKEKYFILDKDKGWYIEDVEQEEELDVLVKQTLK